MNFRLIDGVHSSDEEVQKDSLELLGDLLARFGEGAPGGPQGGPPCAAAAREAKLSGHLMQLLQRRPPTAKRAARCLGALAATVGFRV